jgi:hypothetical protein
MKRIAAITLLVSLCIFSCVDHDMQSSLENVKSQSAGLNETQNFPGITWECNMLTNYGSMWYDSYAWGMVFDADHRNPTTGEVIPIEYNTKGNPVRITSYSVPFDSTITTLAYDQLSQLSRIVSVGYHHMLDLYDYTTIYDFTWESRSVYIKVTRRLTDGAPAFDYGAYRILFDTQERIKENRHYMLSTDASPHHISKYSYNSAGNLHNILYIVPNEGQRVIAEFFSYDNRKNIYRTNKVWQLLFEQYSANNPTYFITRHAYSETNLNRYTVTYLYNSASFPRGAAYARERFNFDTNQWVNGSTNTTLTTYDCDSHL